jgi:23S rRNA U2552 (ribose-2'-O)-methylase RlmE/FtsJ
VWFQMKYLIESSDVYPMEISSLQWKKIGKDQLLILKSYYEEICKEKEKIDQLENGNEWDRIKKIGNPFELIYTSYHKKKKRDSISNYQPISRSYFKMWEMLYHFSDKIFAKERMNIGDAMVFGNLAEGPGGFMEAIYNYRTSIHLKHKTSRDIFYGITLRPHNEYVPDWNKMRKIFGDKPNVHIEYGNLYIHQDIKNYIKSFQKQKAHIVTADGGFDYSADFNGQEINSCQIIYSECVVAMNILREKGTFICKVFDLFTTTMMRILYLLFMNFEEVYFYKPETSRPANSEKYLVCIGYKNLLKEEDKSYLLYLIQDFQTGSQQLAENETFDLLGMRIPGTFFKSIRDYNHLYIQQQKHYLQKTIQLAYERPRKEEYEKMIKTQIKNATDWCKKYGVAINYQSSYLQYH